MTRPESQAKHQHNDCWQVVTDVAEGIVADLEDTDEDRNDLLPRLIHEATDQHDYLIRDDLQIQT